MSADTGESVLYQVVNGIASVIIRKPELHNAQNLKMAHALDAAFQRASADDSVKVIVLRCAGKHFSAGQDIGTSMRDVHQPHESSARLNNHVSKPGGQTLEAQAQEVYLGMCQRWRELPKPSIAMVQGACVAGALMLAWVCDLIVASEDAYFSDPVVAKGMSSVKFLAHAFELNPRIAKEFIFLGDRMTAQRAYQMGMVNRVVPRDFLEEETYCIARRIAQMPQPGLMLAKQTINYVGDLQDHRSVSPP
jgi:enoyl-CoA hydratase